MPATLTSEPTPSRGTPRGSPRGGSSLPVQSVSSSIVLPITSSLSSIVLLQVLVTVTLGYQLLFGPDTILPHEGKAFLLFMLLILTGGLLRLPTRITEAGWFVATLVMVDTGLTAGIMYLSGNLESDIYIAFFLLILIAASSPSFKEMLGLSLVLCAAYGVLLFQEILQTGAVSPGQLLRLPLLLVMAIFYGASVDTVRKERRQRLTLAATHQQTREALEESEERFRQMAENIKEVFWMANAEGSRILYVSPVYEEIWGRNRESLYASPQSRLEAVHPSEREMVEAAYTPENLKNGNYDLEYRIVRPDGTLRWIRDRAFPVRKESGQVYRLTGIAEDITSRKEAQEKLRQEALYDKLTGLPNRALFMDRLKFAMGLSKREKDYSFAVLFLDLDRFKIINDTLGHVVGDQLLDAVGKRLRNCLRPGDTVARIGGDEFTLLLDDIKDSNQVTTVIHRIHKELEPVFAIDGHEVFTTASIGIAVSKPEYSEPEHILRDADAAMYRAKAQGQARHEVFDAAMHISVLSRMELEGELRRAIANQEFTIHYQPIVSMTTGLIAQVEALVRWNRPGHGLESPANFIPMAEDTGLIVPLGDWILRTACQQAKQWQGLLPDPVPVTVNVSLRQFELHNQYASVTEALRDTGLEPSCLVLEITESAVMKNVKATLTSFRNLHELGVGLSIDDFGSGYSSLNHLRQFPIDVLKIDRCFIKDIPTDTGVNAIVRAIIAMAQNLHIQIVAEGVETEPQLEFLRGSGCELIQGYFLAKPLPFETLMKMFRDRTRLCG